MGISSLAATGPMTEVISLLQGSNPAEKATDQVHVTSSRPEANQKQIQDMLAKLQDQLTTSDISINFSTYGEHHEKISVIVTDKSSGKVIREIPPKEIQQLYVRMNELIGTIFNRSA